MFTPLPQHNNVTVHYLRNDKEEITVDGKVRKYYRITALGEEILAEARKKAYELFKEIK